MGSFEEEEVRVPIKIVGPNLCSDTCPQLVKWAEFECEEKPVVNTNYTWMCKMFMRHLQSWSPFKHENTPSVSCRCGGCQMLEFWAAYDEDGDLRDPFYEDDPDDVGWVESDSPTVKAAYAK